MLSFFPRGVLDEILNLIESVSEGFPSYSHRQTLEVKVFRGLLAVFVVEVRGPLYLVHNISKAELFFRCATHSGFKNRYPFTAGLTKRVFQTPAVRTCISTKPL